MYPLCATRVCNLELRPRSRLEFALPRALHGVTRCAVSTTIASHKDRPHGFSAPGGTARICGAPESRTRPRAHRIVVGRWLKMGVCMAAQTGGPRTDGGLFSGVDALVSGILPDSIDDNNSRICGAADLSSGHRWALSTRKNRRQTAVATIRAGQRQTAIHRAESANSPHRWHTIDHT